MSPLQDQEDVELSPETRQEPSATAWALAGIMLVFLYVLAVFLLAPGH